MAAGKSVKEQKEGAITEKKGTATPGRRSRKVKKAKNEPQGNTLTRPFYQTADYFSNVRSELNKVAWPSPRRYPPPDYFVHQRDHCRGHLFGDFERHPDRIYAYRAESRQRLDAYGGDCGYGGRRVLYDSAAAQSNTAASVRSVEKRS